MKTSKRLLVFYLAFATAASDGAAIIPNSENTLDPSSFGEAAKGWDRKLQGPSGGLTCDNCEKLAPGPAAGQCVSYICGGESGEQEYSCCNFVGTECEGRTFDGENGRDFCGTNGENFGGGCATGGGGDFCNNCPAIKSCEEFCDANADAFPGRCWEWTDCFDRCCADANGPDGGVDGWSEFSVCTSVPGRNRNMRFLLSSFSCSCSIEQGPSEQDCVPYCGDGTCDEDETCDCCADDCLDCPTSPPAPDSTPAPSPSPVPPQPMQIPSPVPFPSPVPPQPTPSPDPMNTPSPAPAPATPSPMNPGEDDDPHITMWGGSSYDYFGLCDLVFLKNPGFRNGLGMEIHVRTEAWSDELHLGKARVSNAAVKIGGDLFEVVGPRSDIRYWFNGAMTSVDDSSVPDPSLALGNGRFPINFQVVNDIRFHFRIKLGGGTFLVVEVHNDFVNLNFKLVKGSDFESSLGMMGNFPDGAWVGRDGVTLMDSPQALGQEWQVKEDEPMFFHDISGPQAPDTCKSALSNDDGVDEEANGRALRYRK